MRQTLRIELPPFDFAVIVVIGEFEDCHRHICRAMDIDYPAGRATLGRCYHADGWNPHVWIPRKPRTPQETGTLAHEAVHAAMWLMNWTGVTAEAADDEFFGHAVGYIVAQVLKRAR